MSDNSSKIPLNFFAKANNPKKNPSFESFRDNEIHPVNYKKMDNRASMVDHARLRRNLDGSLDFPGTLLKIMDAVSKYNRGVMVLTPLESSLLALIIPNKFSPAEAAQADVKVQLSRGEKSQLKEMVEARLKEEENYNAGRGGGSVEDRSETKL